MVSRRGTERSEWRLGGGVGDRGGVENGLNGQTRQGIRSSLGVSYSVDLKKSPPNGECYRPSSLGALVTLPLLWSVSHEVPESRSSAQLSTYAHRFAPPKNILSTIWMSRFGQLGIHDVTCRLRAGNRLVLGMLRAPNSARLCSRLC